MDAYVCYSQQLAGFLMMHGQRLLGVEPSRKKLGFSNFLFKKDERLNELQELYLKTYICPPKDNDEVTE